MNSISKYSLVIEILEFVSTALRIKFYFIVE